MTQKKISWKQVSEGAALLAKHLRPRVERREIRNIYAIPRGGLILGVMLSHKLNIPLTLDPDFNTLIVDDIADTGKTLCKFLNENKWGEVATLFYHKQTKFMPEFVVYEKKKQWLVFPWEV